VLHLLTQGPWVRSLEWRQEFLGRELTPEAKKRKKRARDKPAACWAAVAKEIGWVGATEYVLCNSPTLYDTSYSAQKSKPQYSGVTGAYASEAVRRPRAPGRTDMLALAMGITRVEDRPDRDYTVWEVHCKQPTWCSCCRRRGIVKPALTVTLSRRPSKQSWVCQTAGSGCIWLRLGMRMPRVW